MIERHPAKVTYTVATAVGTFTRKTDRVYRFVVVVVADPTRANEEWALKTSGVASWHSTKQLAEAKVNELLSYENGYYRGAGFQILALTQPEG